MVEKKGVDTKYVKYTKYQACVCVCVLCSQRHNAVARGVRTTRKDRKELLQHSFIIWICFKPILVYSDNGWANQQWKGYVSWFISFTNDIMSIYKINKWDKHTLDK